MKDKHASIRLKYAWKLIKEEKMNKSQAFAKSYQKYPIKVSKSKK